MHNIFILIYSIYLIYLCYNSSIYLIKIQLSIESKIDLFSVNLIQRVHFACILKKKIKPRALNFVPLGKYFALLYPEPSVKRLNGKVCKCMSSIKLNDLWSGRQTESI